VIIETDKSFYCLYLFLTDLQLACHADEELTSLAVRRNLCKCLGITVPSCNACFCVTTTFADINMIAILELQGTQDPNFVYTGKKNYQTLKILYH